jgi:ELWxxDGT repeat protein
MLRLLIEKARTRLIVPWLGLGHLAALGFSGSAGAQLARRVADLYTTPGGSNLRGVLHRDSSVELWRTDGRVAGTRRLHHFDFPDAPSLSSLFSGAMSPLGNTLLFAGYDAQHGAELWKSDGTPEGTGLVADLMTGTASSAPDNIASLDDRAFFFAEDGTHGRALVSGRRMAPPRVPPRRRRSVRGGRRPAFLRRQ